MRWTEMGNEINIFVAAGVLISRRQCKHRHCSIEKKLGSSNFTQFQSYIIPGDRTIRSAKKIFN